MKHNNASEQRITLTKIDRCLHFFSFFVFVHGSMFLLCQIYSTLGERAPHRPFRAVTSSA